MTTTPTLPLPDEWRVDADGTVPLPDVARSAATSYDNVHHAVRTGVIPVQRVAGRGGTRRIAVDDALMIVAVAALALACGLAFNALLRSVVKAGGRVTPEGLTIPLK